MPATTKTAGGGRITRILIVDDHPIVREGYVRMIQSQPDLQVCGQAEGMSDGLRIARETNPQVAIIDITLNDGGGVELVQQLHAWNSKLKILVVSAHDETVFAQRCLRAGALGFINKKSGVGDLISAIRHVMDGEVFLSEQMRKRVFASFSGRIPNDEDPVQALSNRELEAFQLLGEGLAPAEIAKRMYLQPKTVDRYRENIKRKLGLRNAAELIQRATQWVLENR